MSMVSLRVENMHDYFIGFMYPIYKKKLARLKFPNCTWHVVVLLLSLVDGRMLKLMFSIRIFYFIYVCYLTSLSFYHIFILAWYYDEIEKWFYSMSWTTSPILYMTLFKVISLFRPSNFSMTHDKVYGSIDCCLFIFPIFLWISFDLFSYYFQLIVIWTP